MAIPWSGGDGPGRPLIDPAECSLCGACVETCPTGTLTLQDGSVRVNEGTPLGCIACAQCEMACPTEALKVTGRRAESARLVELPPRSARATPGQLRALLLARRSVRRFAPEEPSRELLDRILSAAATAPMGIPPSEVGVVVFHGREKVRELARDTAATYRGMLRVVDNAVGRGLLRLFLSRMTARQTTGFILPLGREVTAAAAQGRDKVLYDAPAAFLFHRSPWADPADPFVACTYAMVAAEAEGLGTTMIGCAAPPLARRREVLARYGLPAGNVPAIVLILGTPDVRHERAVERPFASVTYR